MPPASTALYGTAGEFRRRLLGELAAGGASGGAALVSLLRWMTDEEQVAGDLLEAVAGRLRWDAGAGVYEAPPGLTVSIPIAPDQTLPVTVYAAWRHPAGPALDLQFRLRATANAAGSGLRAEYHVDEA